MAGNMDSLQESRLVYLSFMIDTNRINARQLDPHMNQIEEWRKNEVIDVLMAETAYEEARAGGDPRRARKVSDHIFSMTLAKTPGEEEALRAIELVLFPLGARTQNEKNDVDIVFNARKYQRKLITADGASKGQPGGMLGNRVALAALAVGDAARECLSIPLVESSMCVKEYAHVQRRPPCIMVQALGDCDNAVLEALTLLMRSLSWGRRKMEAGELDPEPFVLGAQEEIWGLWFEGFTRRDFGQRGA